MMAPSKEKVLLKQEQETLLIPLFCKAQPGDPILFDPQAQAILARVEYDFGELNIPQKTCLTLRIRAKRIDAYAREFLATHPDSIILHLGCGLDGRFTRVDDGAVEWFDLDLPAVIDLRRKFFAETERYHLIPSSVTDLGWVDAIPAAGRPVMVIAEGLMMYLTEAEVKALILRLQQAFPGCALVFDAYSTLTARKAKSHPSLKKTGATIQWGIDDPREIERWAVGIHLREEWAFTEEEAISQLSWGNRLGFRLAGLVTAARRAHRILTYTLS